MFKFDATVVQGKFSDAALDALDAELHGAARRAGASNVGQFVAVIPQGGREGGKVGRVYVDDEPLVTVFAGDTLAQARSVSDLAWELMLVIPRG